MSILEGNSPGVVENSTVVGAGRNLRHRLSSAAGTTADVARGSALYAWLTKEPEPEVIVIDLRETRLLGPCLGVLDDVVTRVEPAWTGSRVKAGVDRVAALVDRGLRTRPGRLLVALLEPPEPPESDDGDADRERSR